MIIMLKKLTAIILTFTLCFSLVTVCADEGAPELKSPSAVLIELNSGRVLFEKNAHDVLPPASVTKVMTMLLIMEAIDEGKLSFDDMVVGSARAKSMGGSTIFLEEGEQLSVHDMLKGIAVASGNDASVAMAEHIAGSVEAFVELMNKKAYELGMKDTNFVNCNGLDDDSVYNTTSAYDIALMSRELMLKHPKIKEFTTIWMDSLRNGKFSLANTNKLIRFYEGATGLKTGSTSKAKNCLSATAERNGLSLVAVIMKAPTSKDRFADASKLLNYGFGAYKAESILKKDEKYTSVKVAKGEKNEVSVAPNDDYVYLSKKTESQKITVKAIIENIYEAPIEKGGNAGTAQIFEGDKKIAEVNLVFCESVNRKNLFSVYSGALNKWLGGID